MNRQDKIQQLKNLQMLLYTVKPDTGRVYSSWIDVDPRILSDAIVDRLFDYASQAKGMYARVLIDETRTTFELNTINQGE